MRDDYENWVCKNCKFYSKLEHNFEVGVGFEYSHCCTLFANQNSITEVESPYDRCECFTAKLEEATKNEST